MKIPLLILLLGLSSNIQAQFRDFYQPLQNDSIYKNALVKSRHIKYSKKTIKSNTLDTFNEKGQIVKAIIYNLQDGETPQYETRFMYDSTGKLISVFQRTCLATMVILLIHILKHRMKLRPNMNIIRLEN